MGSRGEDSFKTVTSGQPFRPSARRENAITQLIREFGADRFTGSPGDIPAPWFNGWVEIQNNSGTDGDEFDVLGIDGVLINESENHAEFTSRITLKGVTPTVAAHTGLFVITAEPIPNGSIGRAYMGGTVPAFINVNDSSDNFADVLDGDSSQLDSGATGGAQIIWKPAATGSQWCIVRIGGAGGGGFAKPTNVKDLTFAGSHPEAVDTSGHAYDKSINVSSLGTDGGGHKYDGFKVTRACGSAYYDPGDQKIYEYRVDETYNKNGQLTSVSDVYRVQVLFTC